MGVLGMEPQPLRSIHPQLWRGIICQCRGNESRWRGEGAVSQAVKVLKAGGTGDTRWGKIYQLSVKKGTFAKKPWLEPLFRGNAIQQIATTQLRKTIIWPSWMYY